MEMREGGHCVSLHSHISLQLSNTVYQLKSLFYCPSFCFTYRIYGETRVAVLAFQKDEPAWNVTDLQQLSTKASEVGVLFVLWNTGLNVIKGCRMSMVEV